VESARARPSTIGHSASTAAKRESSSAPQHDPPRIDALEPAREAHRRAPILALGALAKALARLAAGVAEVAVVEHEHRRARGRQALGVGRQAVVARQREAVRHHHAAARLAGRLVQPGRAVRIARPECQLAALDPRSLAVARAAGITAANRIRA